MFQRIKAASNPCLLPHHQSAPESLPILGPREKNNKFFLCPFLEQPSNQQTFHFLLYWKGTFKSISSWVSASDPPKHFRPHVPLIFLSFGKHILIYCHHSTSFWQVIFKVMKITSHRSEKLAQQAISSSLSQQDLRKPGSKDLSPCVLTWSPSL